MAPPKLAPVAIEVRLGVREPPQSDKAILQSRITERINDLIEDLDLPASLRLKLTRTSAAELDGESQPVVTIEGKRCRQEMRPPGELHRVGTDTLVNEVAAAVYWNRDLLVTSVIRNRSASDGQIHLSGILSSILAGGLPVTSLDEIVAEVDPTLHEDSQALQVELAIARRSPRFVTIEAGRRLHQVLTAATGRIGETIGSMRDGLFHELGVHFPPCRIITSPALADAEFRFKIGATRGPASTGLLDEEFLVNNTPANLKDSLGLIARPARNPSNDAPAAIVLGEDAAKMCRDGGLTTWDHSRYVVLTLSWHLRAHAHRLLTVLKAQRALSRLAEAFPLAIVDLLERFSPVYVVRVLQALVREGVSIRDLRSVIEAMLEINGEVVGIPSGVVIIAPPVARLSKHLVRRRGRLSPEDCAEYVRTTMKNYLTHKHVSAGELNVIETTEQTEQRLRSLSGDVSHPERSGLLQALSKAQSEVEELHPVPILTAFDIRRALRMAIEIEYPHVSVLSRAEVSELTPVRTRSLLRWE